jgi:putative hemolysin
MRHLTRSILSLLLVAIFLGACSAPAPQSTPAPAQPQPTPGMANPASENCVKQGGTLSIQKRGDGGEYGICLFEDARQCEEWAMMRGECPVGGIKVTGYLTPAAQYCAITGGEYAITGNSGEENEQGTCTFKNGKKCDVWDYFNGKCGPND